MNITARELNRATLGRQLLLGREALGVDDAVRRVVALQAQQPASPYLALWNRLTAFDPAELDVALDSHTLVKATLMRLTLHVVHADDHPAMHTALQPTLRGTGLRGFRRRGMAGSRGRNRSHRLPPPARGGMGRTRWRGPGAGGAPGRPRTAGLPPLRPLVDHPAQSRRPPAPRIDDAPPPFHRVMGPR
jgi:hypothetical protein